MRRWRLVAVAGAAAALGTIAGCGPAPLGGVAGKDFTSLSAGAVPTTIDNLHVKTEQTAKQTAKLTHSYVSGLSFYSLREKTHVEATLEIAQLTSNADINSAAFRNSVKAVVSQGSSDIPTTLLVDGVEVQQTGGVNSVISTWFRGRDLLVLTSLNTFPDSRGLLESVVRSVLS